MSDDRLIAMGFANRLTHSCDYSRPQILLDTAWELDGQPSCWTLKWSSTSKKGYGTDLNEERVGLWADGLPVLTDRAREVLSRPPCEVPS